MSRLIENGEKFSITYQIFADSKDLALKTAEAIRLEQTVEMPAETVPKQAESSLAEIIFVEQKHDQQWIAKLSFPQSIIDGDSTQLLNVLYGNISMLDRIKVIDADDNLFCGLLKGPSFGIDGLRSVAEVFHRPLSCSALKPVGLNSSELAERAYQFACGGIDIVKDDHGLANQTSAPFKDRVISCVQAVRKGEQVSGKKTLYFPNITTSPVLIMDRFRQAVELGADGVLIAPQLTGIDAVHAIAQENLLPVMAHPAFSGSFILHDTQGISLDFYYGKLWRAFGADAVIHPNAGGRFSFSWEACKELHSRLKTPVCDFKKSFPTPAGGIDLASLPGLLEHYGKDTIFLIGGSLYKQKEGIETATKEFQQTLELYAE